ncbi:carboxypeptidase-like regulatory domain-containing protein [Hymenobacter sp. GOD-10R]|uniref:carboxypeptidase-like regulatory domain-containing protein n=1 Tax=Hymenobacter sp. GOD-10R TaxID=3093922 RepID=UPI002D76C65B|nr:carboxypeptidase-like regulatory domain-containing protein [Hymenobacter sp. GOD-10R]WRQ29856.1 carboxypeptidase-like regulatory domain-containing protein [Hymenobacter sp. GOD-10R]
MQIQVLRLALALLGWLSICGNALAQGSISGQVRDSLTHESLAYASVFLANTTRGASTDANGRFLLPDVPAGHYDFIISYLGYKLYQRPVVVTSSALVMDAFLTKASHQLGEVVVRPRPNRPGDYWQFVRMFLGSTSFSRQCRIRNPEAVLVDYDAATKVLTASGTTYVEVENQALGYRIRYYGLRFRLDHQYQIVSFYGHPVFEELATRSARRRKYWEANRRQAYLGSVTHFLRSVHDDRVTEEGYLVQKVRHVRNPKWPRADSLLRVYDAAMRQHSTTLPFSDDSLEHWRKVPPMFSLLYTRPVLTDSLRKVQPDSGRVWLRFHDLIQVTYQREQPDPAYLAIKAKSAQEASGASTARQLETSLVYLLQSRVEIQQNGQLVNPLAILNEGYWGFEKIGEMLPFDYSPPKPAP